MQVKIIRKTEQKTSQWSGGTTTQLAIFPETATYDQRDFLFRISTAQVLTEESEFTSLPGISRSIMILEGNLTLNHEGHYSKTLQKFDSDTFDGGWKTTSSGKVTDFNLMTSSKATGTLLGKTLQPQQTCTEIDCKNYDVVGVYLLCGTAEIGCNGKKYIIGENDFLMVFFDLDFDKIKLTAHEYCEFAVAVIQLNQS
jgi:environmental stress-induced protein Ves